LSLHIFKVTICPATNEAKSVAGVKVTTVGVPPPSPAKATGVWLVAEASHVPPFVYTKTLKSI
jgi:hypothetical protein